MPVFDFYSVYKHDFGNSLMGLKNGRHFAIELGHSYNEKDIEICLDDPFIFESLGKIYNN